MTLTATSIAALSLATDKTDAIFFDSKLPGFGIRLRRAADGRVMRSFIAQYRAHARSRRVLIGDAAMLTLAQARTEATRILAQAKLGQDPQQDRTDRREGDKLRFRTLVDEYLTECSTRVRRKTGEPLRPATMRALKLYLTDKNYFGPLHAMPIDRIARADIASCLRTISRRSGENTAFFARSKLGGFLAWCVREGFCETNAILGTRQPDPAPARARVLTDDELVHIWNACGDPSVGELGKIVQLNCLIPARRSELGGLRRSELDAVAETWTLGAARSKNHRAITYPLSATAMAIIDTVPERAGRDCLFGERTRFGFSAWTKFKARLDAKSGVTGWVLHDVRRSIATKMADIGIEPHIIEVCLNHHGGHRSGPAGIYNRSNYQRQMKAALGLWEDHLRALVEGGERKVLMLPTAAK